MQKGHQVTVLTGLPNYPGGKIFDKYGFFSGPWKEDYKGAHVIRVPLIPRGKGFFRLSINYLSFILFGIIPGFFKVKNNFDVVFCFATSPITSCLPAIAISKWTRKPLALWVLDLWPESISAVGAVKQSWFLNLVGLAVKFIYKYTDLILIQSEAFRPSVKKWGGQNEKIEYLPNWSQIPTPKLREPEWIYQLPKCFKVVFAGNIGKAQDMPTLIAAAEVLKDFDIKWIVVGDGSAKADLEEEIQKRGLRNSIFTYGRRPSGDMAALYDKCDAGLVLLTDEEIFGLTVPQKMQSYMASRKPIIASIDGEGHRLVSEVGCGLASAASRPQELADNVLKMFKMSPEERNRMGSAGYQYFIENFEEDRVIKRLIYLLEDRLIAP